MHKIYRSHIYKGLILSALLMMIDLLKSYNLYFILNESKVGGIVFIVIILFIFFSCIVFSKYTDKQISFQPVFVHGFKTMVVAICIFFIYELLMVYVFDPTLVEATYNRSLPLILQALKNDSMAHITDTTHMLKKGVDTTTIQPSQIIQKMSTNKVAVLKLLRLSILTGVVIWNLVLGLIGSIIAAIFCSKVYVKNPHQNN